MKGISEYILGKKEPCSFAPRLGLFLSSNAGVLWNNWSWPHLPSLPCHENGIVWSSFTFLCNYQFLVSRIKRQSSMPRRLLLRVVKVLETKQERQLAFDEQTYNWSDEHTTHLLKLTQSKSCLCTILVREHLLKKECFLSGIARITSPPFRATCTSFFGRQNRRFARMTEKIPIIIMTVQW